MSPSRGSWLNLNNHSCPGCIDDWVTPVVFTMFGVVQAVGAALFASGFLFPQEHVIGGESAAAGHRNPHAIAWAVTPSIVGPSGLGVSAVGTLF
jgi:hypothetical protein